VEPEIDALPNPMIYDSLEALDEYLNQVRVRRETRRENRLAIERHCLAIAKVTEEYDAARQDGDTEIAMELQGVLGEFERRLKTLQTPALQSVVQRAPSAASTLAPTTEQIASVESTPQTPTTPSTASHATEQPLQKPLPVPVTPPATTVAATVINKEQDKEQDYEAIKTEIEAQKHVWLTEIETLEERWNALDNEGLRHKDKSLNRPACLRMRALACSLASIQTQADLAGLHSHVTGAVTALRNRMEFARVYAGDKSEAPPFAPTFWSGNAEHLTAQAWDELAYLYEEVATAQEAWDWYAGTRDETGSSHYALLNAVGAAQQMLFRALEEYGGNDRLQGDLFGNLREAAGSVGFLSSLNQGTTWPELEAMAREVPRLFAQAQREAVIAQEKRETEARKAAALEALLRWQEANSSQPVAADSVTKARAQLLPLLDACLAAGIPATNVQVRSAILHVAPVLLTGMPKYSKFLEAVLAERKRKGLDAVAPPEPEPAEDEDLPDSQITESIEWVRMLTEGQKVLILGGSSRPQVADKLKQLLHCASVEWLDSKKGDRMNKFKMDITRSDVVVAVKKFASHEMTEKGRDWAKDYGKLFVLLPSGYGVNQIIYQMYLQLVPPDVSKRAEISTAKAGVGGLGNLNLISG
jgi:hypothetical protein